MRGIVVFYYGLTASWNSLSILIMKPVSALYGYSKGSNSVNSLYFKDYIIPWLIVYRIASISVWLF